jgi:uncharacterized protein YcbK (DUF882 family)
MKRIVILAVILALWAAGGTAAAGPVGSGQAGTEPAAPDAQPGKKQRLLEEKAQLRSAARPGERARWDKALRRRIGQKPPAVINIHNTWTHEFIAVEAGTTANVPAETVNRFLRCHFTGHRAAMDAHLFGVLIKAATHFKSPRVDIVSGFRAPKYNLMLRKKGRRVARNSEHTFGNAVDFRLPGVTTERLRNWARRLRLGGVGYYRDDAFVHVDTGPVRYWAE